MIIEPQRVSPDDPQWHKACELFRVLALDPRRKQWKAGTSARFEFRNKAVATEFFESADDYLKRPEYWREGRQQLADSYIYNVHFGVACAIVGSIPVNDLEQLDEFRRTLNAALHSPFTEAARRRWRYEEQWRKHRGSVNEPERQMYAGLQAVAASQADSLYDAARAALWEKHADSDWHEQIIGYLATGGARQLPGDAVASNQVDDASAPDDAVVLGVWTDRIVRALAAASEVRAQFHTTYQERNGETRSYHAHTGQAVQLRAAIVAPNSDFDEEALPYLIGRFEDGTELHCANEEILSKDSRIQEVLDAVAAGFHLSRTMGYVGPFDFAEHASPAEKAAFVAQVKDLKFGPHWKANPNVFECDDPIGSAKPATPSP